jgi:DNA-binding NarL/FixJ family response regulator
MVEDHSLVRAGIRALLEKLGWVQVMAEAGNGREALDLIKTHRPDVLLVDISMSDLNGLELTDRVRKSWPNIRVIIISMHRNEEYVLHALQAGATGYVLKDAGTNELEIALKAVSKGETYLSPPISKYVVSNYLRRMGAGTYLWEQLTRRQREILQLIAEGYTTKEIAQKLNVDVKTVDTLRTQLMKRLDIHNIAGLVRYAIRKGVVTADK